MRLTVIVTLLSAACAQTPQDFYARAQQAVAARDWNGAVEDCTLALGAGVNFHDALLMRALARSMLGQRAEAITDLDALLKVRPESSAFAFRGNQHLLLKHNEAAAADFGEAIKLTPNSSALFQLRAEARNRLGEHAAAIEDRAKSSELASQPPQTNRGGDGPKSSGRISAAKVLSQKQPAYSIEAQSAKVQGDVVVSLVVDENGWARDLWIVTPLGYGLDERAIEALQQWRFKPATRDENPVASPVTIEVQFRLL